MEEEEVSAAPSDPVRYGNRISRRRHRWILFTCCFIDSSSSRYTPRLRTTETGEIISQSIWTCRSWSCSLSRFIRVLNRTASVLVALKTARSTPTRHVGRKPESRSRTPQTSCVRQMSYITVNRQHRSVTAPDAYQQCRQCLLCTPQTWSQHGSMWDATIHLVAGSVLTVIDKRLRSVFLNTISPCRNGQKLRNFCNAYTC